MNKPKLEALRLDGIDYTVEYHATDEAHGVCLTVVWEDWGNGIFEPAVALAFPERYATEAEIQQALLAYHAVRPAFAHFVQQVRGRRALARFA
jgi:hypothetical protein